MNPDARTDAWRMQSAPSPRELKQVDELCVLVNRAGGTLLLHDDGRLWVIQPHGGLPPHLRSAIRSLKPALLHYLAHGRYLSEEEIVARSPLLETSRHG